MTSSSLKYWLFLFCSILFEVGGTSIMKASQSFASAPARVSGLAAMYVLLGASYICLAKAVVRLPIGVAYAFWEGLGLALITLVSVLALGESFTPARRAALALILVGAILVHHGTESGSAKAGAAKTGPEQARPDALLARTGTSAGTKIPEKAQAKSLLSAKMGAKAEEACGGAS
ncbi:multidrug efflux SMR transporter [Desulfovibrio sp. OttesenSCG-928-C14]|nr:multidrug efflux SMR transporter [Desulfovibrio sp. OttesenSCG-928-C14]